MTVLPCSVLRFPRWHSPAPRTLAPCPPPRPAGTPLIGAGGEDRVWGGIAACQRRPDPLPDRGRLLESRGHGQFSRFARPRTQLRTAGVRRALKLHGLLLRPLRAASGPCPAVATYARRGVDVAERRANGGALCAGHEAPGLPPGPRGPAADARRLRGRGQAGGSCLPARTLAREARRERGGCRSLAGKRRSPQLHESVSRRRWRGRRGRSGLRCSPCCRRRRRPGLGPGSS